MGGRGAAEGGIQGERGCCSIGGAPEWEVWRHGGWGKQGGSGWVVRFGVLGLGLGGGCFRIGLGCLVLHDARGDGGC